MGKVEAVKFVSYDKIEEKFQQEFEVLYAQNQSKKISPHN
jgi:hypothetical protein